MNAVPAMAPDEESASPFTVLVVEDQDSVRAALVGELHHAGVSDVLQAANGNDQAEVKRILQLFGISGDAKLGQEMRDIGPSRLSFWDCNLQKSWEDEIRNNNQMLTEVKSENRINRISGAATDPRQTERVPAGARFDFRLSIKRLAGDGDELLATVLQGLKLLELDSLGGSGSRGYGKVKFVGLTIDGQDAQARFDAVQPFAR